jgi:predicted esterase
MVIVNLRTIPASLSCRTQGVNEMKDISRAFIHGLDSSSRGTKGNFFRERYPEMFLEDYSGPLEERMAKLERDLAGKRDLILVGSSYGGLMAAIFACRDETRVRRLILLAPALGHTDLDTCSRQPLQIPVTLYHGRSDPSDRCPALREP